MLGRGAYTIRLQGKVTTMELLTAAKYGNLVLVRALLSHPSCDLLARDEDGNTALHIAASRGHHEVVLELASRYTTASSECIAGMNNEGDTPLHLACRNGSMKCVKVLANTFPNDLNEKNSSGDTPLRVALLAEHNEVVLLLHQKYDISVDSDHSTLPKSAGDNDEKNSKPDPSCLLAAVRHGDLVQVRALLSHPSCDLLARDEDGNTALHIAANRGHHELVLELASRYMSRPSEASAGVNSEGQTPLHLACYKGWLKCIDPLAIKFPNEMNVQDKNGNTPIMAASAAGHDNITSLLKERYEINSKSKGGQLKAKRENHKSKCKKDGLTLVTSCLLEAAKQGSLVLVRALLSHPSCDLLARDEDGNTVLHIAASRGYHEVVLELASKCMTAFNEASTCINDKGQTALHLACCKGWVECVRTLATRFPGDLRVKNKYDNLSLHDAALFGHGDIVDTLYEEFGEDVDSLGHLSGNCLLLACSGGHINLTNNLLIRYQCQRDVLDKTGGLVSNCAAFYGHTHLLQMLIDEFKFSSTSVQLTDGLSLLHAACIGKHYETANILITKYQLVPTAKDLLGQTALHHVCGPLSDSLDNVGDFHVPYDVEVTTFVDWLISLKCDPMDKDKQGLTALHYAAFSGQTQVVLQLVKKYHCPVECRDNNGHTPLHKAAAKGHTHVVQVLLSELGADVEARDKQNNTVLNMAALNGHNHVVALLVDQFGCSPDTKGYNNTTLLHHACLGGHLELVGKLIDDYHCDPMARDDEGLTPLHIAALAGKEHIVRHLVSKYDCPVECRDNKDHTPLHKAAARGHTHVVEVLLSELGADVETRNKQNDTVLNMAALNGHNNVVALLVDQFGCSPDAKGYNNRTLLHHACHGGHLELADQLIDDYHCDPMARDDEGLTPLHIAALAGKEHMVRHLVSKYDCPVECRDNNDHTPLHKAAARGHTHVVQVLLSELGADVEARDKQNNTVLNMAALNGYNNVVALLVDQFGCSPDTKGYNNRTLLHHACVGSHLELVEKLIDDYHCDPMARDDEGLTPLHIAALAGKEHVVRHLVSKYDCPVECRDNKDHTPLHKAAARGHTHVVQILLSEFRADVEARNKQNDRILNMAALNGHNNVVALLVDQFGCSPDTNGYNNRTLVHHACLGGHLELVEKLIDDYHCDPMVSDDKGLTPLHIAALAGKEHVVRQLVSKYVCPVECRDNKDHTPLHKAGVKGHTHVVEVLLSEFGADVEARDKQNDTVLNMAALNGHNNVVTLLVDQFGCSPDTKGYNNRTLLHHACMGGHLELVDQLIDDYHCDPMARDDKGLTPLHIAALAGKEHMVRHLVSKYDCPVECRDNKDHTPLHKAGVKGHMHVVEVLLSEFGADVEARDKQNDTVLNMTALNGHNNVVTLLVDQFGCSPDTKGYNNRTLLHHACMGGHLELVDQLIDDYHCDPMARDDEGLTPLHIAALAGKKSMGKRSIMTALLLKYKCSPHIFDPEGNTILHLFVNKGSSEIVRMLVDIIGAFSSMKNNKGKTPLDCHLIHKPGVKACVDYLSQHAVGEYRHAPHKLLVFDNGIISSLNTYSTYSLFCSTSAQSCGICYMDSIDSDIWVCHVAPDTQNTPVLQSLMLAPLVMAVITVDFGIPTAQAVCKVISQVSLVKKNAFRNDSKPVLVRILLIGFSPHNKESLFKTVCQTVITNQKSDSIQFSQQAFVCQDGEYQQQLYPVLSQFISISVSTVPNLEVLEITHGSICLLKFLYREIQNKSYISFSDLSKQLQNERIMTDDNPKEIHACLRQLDEQGYLVTTGTFDNPQYILLNPLQLLHTIDEFLCNVTEQTEPLVLVGFCSKKLLSSCLDLDCRCIESFMSKFNLSTVVSNALVNLVKKEDLHKPVKHSYCFIPKLATCQRQITHWTCQPDIVFPCGLSIVAIGKENTFSSQFLSTTLLQAIKLFTSSYLVEPYRGLECNLWKGGVHWIAEKVEVLLEVVDGGRCVLLIGRSDTCRQLQCTDMFVKVVDMVMDVKSQCCGETMHKIEVLDPAALQSHCIPSATELLWCDATSVIRATRIGKATIQSTCKTKQFSVKKMDWLHRFTLYSKHPTHNNNIIIVSTKVLLLPYL